MDEKTQFYALLQMASDIESRVGEKVICEPDNKSNPYHFHLKCQKQYRTKKGEKEIFGYAKIKPRKGCLLVSTWDKLLTPSATINMPNSVFKEKMHWNDDGRKWDIYKSNGEVYKEAVFALTLACKAVDC